MLRRAINAAVEQCGATAPLQRVTSPGYMMAMMDWAALSLAVGAAVRSGQGTFAALQGHPFEVTASSALDSPPEAWVAGIGGAAAVAMGYLCTGLSERLRGRLTMAAFPAPFSLADARDLMISRMTSMARSGLVQVGAMPGMLMWTLRAVLTSPGGVLDLMGTPHRAIAASSAALTAATIGPMANEWFTQARRNDRGAPGEGMQNQINLNANIPVQSRRWRAEFAEARAERAADRDGDVATEILRDVSEVLGTVMCVGSGLSAVQHSDFRVPESAMDEFLEMSAAAGAPAFAAGFVLQMVALRAATGPWGELLGRNDPQSQRASSNLVAGLIGAASAGAARWDAAVIPAAAAGAAAEALLEVAYRRTTAADHKYPVEAAVAPNNIDGLIHNGRGRRVGESFLEFQASKWAENIRDPILGRPPGADAAAVPLAPAGEDGAAADPLAVPVPIPVVPGNGAGNLHLRVNKKGTPARENDRPTRPRIHAIPASNILPSGGEADGIEAKGQDREMRTLTHFAAVPHSPPDPAAEPPSLNSSFNGIAADRG